MTDGEDDHDCIDVDGSIQDGIKNEELQENKSVAVGDDLDQEESEPIQGADKNVQTEQVRRQQSCSSRASLDSQRSISFFIDFDDGDINGNDAVFSGNISFIALVCVFIVV